MKKDIRVFISLLIITVIITAGGILHYGALSSNKHLDVEGLSSKIEGHLVDQGTPVRFSVIKKTVEYSNSCIQKEFPNGPFTVKDLVAIAMIESRFNQFTVGPKGERGVFQILEFKEELKELGMSERNIFDVDVNSAAMCNILKKKYHTHHDYYEALIAYNGFILKDEHIQDTYWKKFVRAREDVETFAGE